MTESITCVYNETTINSISGSNINSISGSNINSISGSNINSISGSVCSSEPTLEYRVTSQKPNIKFIPHDNISVSISGLKVKNSVRETT